MSELSHRVEDLLLDSDPRECVTRLINVKDWLIRKFESLQGQGSEPEPVEEMIAMLGDAGIEAVDAAAPANPDPGFAPAEVETEAGYYDMNILDGDVDLIQEFISEALEHLESSEAGLLLLEADRTDNGALDAVFRAFHTIKGVAGFIDMDHIRDFAHKSENLLDVVRKGEVPLDGGAMDLIFESVDLLKILVNDLNEAIRTDGCVLKRPEYAGVMEQLIACASGATAPGEDRPEASGADDLKSGLVVLGNRNVADAEHRESPGKQADGAEVGGNDRMGKTNQIREALRVDAERLDLLVETIGELVIAEAMVSQNPAVRNTQSMGLLGDIDHLDKICRELQELGTSLRMVPVRPIFQKMARLVRDLSKKSGRKIRFVTRGEDTELDKSVVEKISDPLVHMLRNAVDHGIESNCEQRLAAGKTREGNIELSASHKGGNICIEVRDDGRGLDRDAILAKAIERGLVAEGATLSDREILNLIFEPGFSTSETVTDVSGRGVGMDVVRRNVEEMRGAVDIRSEPGQGSVFSFRLPLTMAIIDGMVIRCGAEHYIVPTLSVVRLVRPTEKQYSTVMERGEMLRFEEDLIPMYRLNRLFDVPDARDRYDKAVVVVVESEGKRIGLMTDDLEGQQQIVIKSLGETVQGTDGIAGGAIMSNGNVALILDVAGLVKVAHESDADKTKTQETD